MMKKLNVRGALFGLLLVCSTGEILAQTNPDLKAMADARQQRVEILSQRHNLGDDNVRVEVVRQLQAADDAQQAAVSRRAKARGLALEGDKPGGGRIVLVDFDENDQPVYQQTENLNAAISTAANLVRSNATYTVNGSLGSGSGVKIGQWEAGGVLRQTHQELAGRVTIADTTTVTDHATHVAGTMISAGINHSTLGMAPSATIACRNSVSDDTEMTAAGAASPASTGIFLSNHSYGLAVGWEGNVWYGSFSDDGNPDNDVAADFGRYSSDAVSFDGIAYNLPYYLIFISAGNHRNDTPPVIGGIWTNASTSTAYIYDPAQHPKGDGIYKSGYDCMEGNKLAKNVMTVGAVNDAVSGGSRSLANATMTTFSSWGPADDGRIKPDIMANGYNLYSCGGLSDTDALYLSGTSMASPNACGSAALLINYYKSLFPGGAMRASTLKTLMLHTADDLGTPGPDYQTGWGLMNTKAAADVIKQHAANGGGAAIVESAVSTGITSRTFTNVWNGTAPLRVTLGWTDPAGALRTSNDNRNKELVNDLNLTVSRVGGATYYPYVMPYVGDWSTNKLGAAAVTGVNTVDNTEQVYLATPAAGTYIITVNYTGALSGGVQEFSLIASGQANSWIDDASDHYTETFDGSGGIFNGKTTTTGGGIWRANSIVTNNGVLSADAGSAILPFHPVPNRIYTLSMDFNYSAGTNGWLGLGFSSAVTVSAPGAGLTADRFSNANVPGYAWMIYNSTRTVTVFEGPQAGSTTILSSGSFASGVHTLKIILNTTGDGSSFTADFFVDNTSVTGGPQTIDAVTLSGIQSVGFTQYGSSRVTGSTVDNFSLTSASIGPIQAPTLSYTPTGGSLFFDWSGSGFKLQMQTNNSLSVGLGTNWVNVPGGGSSGVSVPVTANPTAFFRLISTP